MSPAGMGIGPTRLLSDDRLARRATRGDQRAFEEIYRRYRQDLYRFCLAMLGNPQDAQDALQNTMVKALRALPGEQRNIHLKPWLYRIARNESVETIRRRRDGVAVQLEETPAPAEIAETVEARERLWGLFRDLGELPERQRAAVVMRELGGLPFEQIGEALKTSAAVARQTLYEARLSLRMMEAGREMDCEAVMHDLSDADGRVTRRRDLRAHLRSCASCREFGESISKRRDDFAAISPLPAVASMALLNGILGGSGAGAAGAGASGGLTGAVGVAAGKVGVTSVTVKSVATVAVVAAVGVTAADRGGLIDIPIRAKGDGGNEVPAAAPERSPTTPEAGGRGDFDGSGGGDTPEGDQSGGQNSLSVSTLVTGQRSSDGPSHSDSAGAHRGDIGPKGNGHRGEKDESAEIPSASGGGQQIAAENKSPRASDPPGQQVSEAKVKGPKKKTAEEAPPESPAPPPTEPEDEELEGPPGSPGTTGPPDHAKGNGPPPGHGGGKHD